MECIVTISETNKKGDENEYASFEYEDEYDRRDKVEVLMKDILDETVDWDDIYIKIKTM